MAIIGVLMCITACGEEGEDRIGITAVDVTAEQALERVRQDELHNIGFDGSANETDEEREHTATMEAGARRLAWPEAANENGQFVIASAWAGGLDDEGMEWRFAPVVDLDRLDRAA